MKNKEKIGERIRIRNILMKDGYLKEMYIQKGLTMKEIANISKCSISSIGRAFKKFHISTRKPKSKYSLLNNREWLKDAYLNKKYSTSKIAKIAGCDDGLVYGILRDTLKIPMRTIGEAQKIRGKRDRRENSSAWKGGKTKSQGYIFIYQPNNPMASKVGYVAEHRLIAAKMIGRKLKKEEIVHHLNGKKDDNHPNNLVVLNRGEHRLEHAKIFKELIILRKKVEKYEKKYSIKKN